MSISSGRPWFEVSVTARQYESDVNGHVTHARYLDWTDHARYEYLGAAGIDVGTFRDAGVGPAILELTVKYLGEVRAGQVVTVTVEPEYDAGKTFTLRHRILRLDRDGTQVLAAEQFAVMGLLDHTTRRLVPEPLTRLQALATDPERLTV
jgi:acyl-CoA thioester hydrolase